MATETDRAILARLDAYELISAARHTDTIGRLVRIETLAGQERKNAADHEARLRALEGARQWAVGVTAGLSAAAAVGGGTVVSLVSWLMSS